MNTFELIHTAAVKSSTGRGSRAAFLRGTLERLDTQFKGDITKLLNAIAMEFAHNNTQRLACYAADQADQAQKYPAPQVCAGALQLVMNACSWALRRHQTDLFRAEMQVASGEAISTAEHLNFTEAFSAEHGVTDSASAGQADIEATADETFGFLSNVHHFMWQTLNGRRVSGAKEFELEPLSMFHRSEVTEDDEGASRWETVVEALSWDEALTAMNAQIDELRDKDAVRMNVAASTIDFTVTSTLQ